MELVTGTKLKFFLNYFTTKTKVTTNSYSS